MSLLDALIPQARLREVHRVDLASEPAAVYGRVRHGNLGGGSALVKGLFWTRELSQRGPARGI